MTQKRGNRQPPLERFDTRIGAALALAGYAVPFDYLKRPYGQPWQSAYPWLITKGGGDGR